MSLLLMAAVVVFSYYAGRQAAKAFYTEKNKRKAWTLLGMWAVIYAAYLVAHFEIS